MTTLTQVPQQERAPKKRPSRGARGFGYAVAIVINVLLIFAINEWPGWEEVSFLTDETARVIPLVNAALVISIVANAIYLIADPRWLRALGEAINAAVAFVVIVVVFSVWPFDFSSWSFDWTMLVQIMGVVGLVGSLVSVVTNLVTFTREVGRA
jgi:hypothetical protein